MTYPEFYNTRIKEPLSLVLNTPGWSAATLGRLHAESGGAVFLRQVPGHSLNAPYCWRVVDAYYSKEDSVMTQFRAYDQAGYHLPYATFGVTWDSCPHELDEVWRLKYVPEFGGRYYVPDRNEFHTPNAGGYTVQVLDCDYPSEGLAFGLNKKDTHHCLIVSFRLFTLNLGYPNDGQYYPQERFSGSE